MDVLIAINRYLHIGIGFAGLAAWWIPILTAKGGRVHKRMGKLFAIAGLTVGTTAVLSTPLRVGEAIASGEPWLEVLRGGGFLFFLSYLGILTINMVYFGVRVLRTRRDPATLDTPTLRVLSYGLMAASLGVVTHALAFWSSISIIMLILGPLGFFGGRDQLVYLAKSVSLRKPWFYAHMDAMLGAGIAFHTAFLVFGSRMVFDLSVFGAWNWVPWVIPGVVGAIGGGVWKRSYMRKFGDVPTANARLASS